MHLFPTTCAAVHSYQGAATRLGDPFYSGTGSEPVTFGVLFSSKDQRHLDAWGVIGRERISATPADRCG